jgi:phosphatidylinositol glycan class B
MTAPARVVLSVALLGSAAASALWIWTSPSTLSPDEVFQSVEQGYRVVHERGVVPWEFRQGVRSWILPGILAGVMWLGGLLGGLAHLMVIPVVIALAGLGVPWTAYASARSETARWSAVVAAIVCAFWIELLLYSPRPLAEVVGTHALVPGLALAYAGMTPGRVFAGGLLISLAAVLRIQLGPVAVLAAIWICGRDADRWRWLLLGALGPVLATAIVDWATWGAPFASAWRYFVVNIVEKRSETYGVSPPLTYVIDQARVWGPAGAPLVALALLGARRAPLYLACAVAIVAIHSAIPHKEHRFIYPAIALLVVLAAVGTSIALEWLRGRGVPLALSSLVALGLWGVGSWDVSRRLDEETVEVFPRTRVPGVPLWQVRRGPLAAFRHIAKGPPVCGVGLVDVPWWETGGAAGLVQDAPIYEGPFLRAIDTVVTRVKDFQEKGYRLDRCFDDVCVYRRRGGNCVPQRDKQVTRTLSRRGE